MAFNQSFGQRPPGPGRGPGMGGGGPRMAPVSEALRSLKELLTAGKASFADDKVMALAETLGRDLAQGFQRKEKKESGKTQVRKLYGEIRALQGKAKGGFAAARPELRLIQAHVAYAVGRDTLTPEFKDFIDEAIRRLLAAGTTDELDRFVKFFEAVYAHFYFQTSRHGQKEG
jgi:CRISPR type III-A-associated protein Csm2